jgi:hypothetical protein
MSCGVVVFVLFGMSMFVPAVRDDAWFGFAMITAAVGIAAEPVWTLAHIVLRALRRQRSSE